ncbi:unnamed protein product [Paramecium pentaurelia]|uniref:Cyclic nucleotide-binding domain-containing protein n=1 Tax=Paramecium pentaurelia TaxID=43138 RepID=A0A8S1X867_9CILI|nr:unnamed protein product [Paramecium pentaurelia]
MLKNRPILCTEEPLDEDQIFIQSYQVEQEVPNVSVSISEVSQSQEDSKKVFEIPQVLIEHHEQEKLKEEEFRRKSEPKKGFAKLVQLLHIRQFIHQILAKRRLISKITKYHLQVINDKASSLDDVGFRKYGITIKPLIQSLQENTQAHLGNQQRKQLLMQRTKIFIGSQMQRFYGLIQKIPLIKPDSKMKVVWDSILFICRFYLLFTIPIDLAWPSIQLLFYTLEVPTVICITLLIMDFFVCLFQSYYHQGQLVTDRMSILKHQIGKAYGFEMIANILLIIFYNISNQYDYGFNVFENPYYIFLFLQFVQYKNISQLRQQLEDALNLSREAASLVELSKLFVLLFFVIHVFACLWFWVGLYSETYLGISWLEAKSVLDKSFADQYLYSFYYSTVTMFTVGYGDITPQTNPEMIVSVIFMSVCSVQLSYSVSTVSSIIEQISGFKEEKKRKFNIINNYMQSKNISYELQFQIREYLNYFWTMKRNEESNEEKEIIEELSSRLKQRLIFEANSRILYNSPFFKENFSLNFKKDLVSKITSITIAPENVLDYTKQSQDEHSLSIFFIEQGQIEVFIENEQLSELSRVYKLKEGESFGFLSFITGNPSVEKYKTIGFTKLLIITRKDFLDVIKDYPDDYEIFYSFFEELTFNSESELLTMECFSCKSKTHKAVSCPLLHFKPDREKVIKSAQFSWEQQRDNKIKRKDICYIKAILGQSILNDVAKQVQSDNQQLTYLYEEFDEEKSVTPKVQFIENSDEKSNLKNNNNNNDQNIQVFDFKEESFKPQNKQKKQLLRKKQTLQDIGDIMQYNKKQKEAKEKFRSIVKKVNLMNDFVEKQVEDSQQKLKSQYREYLKIIQYRKSRIQHVRNIYSNKTIHELEFFELKLKMLLSKEFDIHLDVQKSYKYFKPKENLYQVLSRTKISMLSNTNEMQIFLQQKSQQLIKYLFYPYLYIQKYVFKYRQSDNLGETKKKQLFKRNNRISLAFIMQQHSSIRKP